MDKNGEDRKLSAAEQRRLEAFEKTSEEMIRQGYTRHNLTIYIGKANVFAIILMILLLVIGYGLYYLVHRHIEFPRNDLVIIVVELLVFTVIHELIHGACWSLFAPNHFRDIEFGILKRSMTPYCACLVPLTKQQYLFGTAMPLIVLGILPMIAGIAFGNTSVLFIGIVMADGAAGDIMIIQRALGHKSGANDIVFMDHPTEAGCVAFER